MSAIVNRLHRRAQRLANRIGKPLTFLFVEQNNPFTGAATVQVEAFTSIDGQGKPSYVAPVGVQAKVMREVKTVRTGDGSEIRVTLTVWVRGEEPYLPVEQDRITSDGKKHIVVMRQEIKSLDLATLDHVMLECREE